MCYFLYYKQHARIRVVFDSLREGGVTEVVTIKPLRFTEEGKVNFCALL